MHQYLENLEHPVYQLHLEYQLYLGQQLQMHQYLECLVCPEYQLYQLYLENQSHLVLLRLMHLDPEYPVLIENHQNLEDQLHLEMLRLMHLYLEYLELPVYQ